MQQESLTASGIGLDWALDQNIAEMGEDGNSLSSKKLTWAPISFTKSCLGWNGKGQASQAGEPPWLCFWEVYFPAISTTQSCSISDSPVWRWHAGGDWHPVTLLISSVCSPQFQIFSFTLKGKVYLDTSAQWRGQEMKWDVQLRYYSLFQFADYGWKEEAYSETLHMLPVLQPSLSLGDTDPCTELVLAEKQKPKVTSWGCHRKIIKGWRGFFPLICTMMLVNNFLVSRKKNPYSVSLFMEYRSYSLIINYNQVLNTLNI